MDAKTRNDQMRQLAIECWFLTGATASGKTEVSLEMARRLDAEIISLDSMAIYRGMDIGTAKPPPEVRQQVPHHLVDILEPTEEFSVTQYRERAVEKIGEIRERGRKVLFVGGSAMYLKILLRGIFAGPPADWEFRKQVQQELEETGSEALHHRLQQVDPLAAHKLHVRDHRRVIRALEVYKLTGRPISHWQQEFERETPAEQCRVFTLWHSRTELHRRIDQRVQQMFERGLVEEVQDLTSRHGELGRTASQAVGYREVLEMLEGRHTLAHTVERVRARTRQFARHQETWFRHLSECRPIKLAPDFDATAVAESILKAGRNVAALESAGNSIE